MMGTPTGKIDLVAIGASAGAIEAIRRILPALPEGFRPAVVVLVHLPLGASSHLTEVFAPECRLPVKEAEDKEPIVGGRVYLAPSDYHLLVERDRTFSLSVDDPVNFSRPSIDVLFESAADAYEERLLGIILTGASDDGAAGLARVRQRGGKCWVQDPRSAEIPVMPQAAIRATGAAATVADLAAIARFVAGL